MRRTLKTLTAALITLALCWAFCGCPGRTATDDSPRSSVLAERQAALQGAMLAGSR
jgi:hypothetical protein